MTKDEALKLVLADIEANIAAVRTSTITAIKEALAQPPVAKPHEQEPVAWQKIECPICGDMAIATDILTPQRKPLTDEQINEIVDEYLVDYRIPAGCAWNFARDIEAAHGITAATQLKE